jgi:mRNA-degrading endonuclease RelE of RelBE toxin-antitoxin system
MRLLETAKFQKLRKRLKDRQEHDALKEAVLQVFEDPAAGKKLKGEFKDLLSYRFKVRGQARRLIYKRDGETITLLTFGPRQGVYK